MNVGGLYSGKNLYNNEHVAIKLVSLYNSLFVNTECCYCEFGPVRFHW